MTLPRRATAGPARAIPRPPDLDELWRDFNRKLSGLFGGRGGRNGGTGSGGGTPDMKGAGIGIGLIGAIAVLIWLGTGFFITDCP